MTPPHVERWRAVEGWPYEVSTFGRCRRVGGSPLKATPTGQGYLQVTLSDGGRRAARYVHRLVLETFVGPCPPHHETRHLNGERGDNRLANLTWGSLDENLRDKAAHGKLGRRMGEAERAEIARRRADGQSVARIATELGISAATVRRWSSGPRPSRTTPEQKARIRVLLAEGKGLREIAREVGVSPPTVARVRDRDGPG